MKTDECASSFTVVGEGGRVTVEILGHENLSAQTVPDANWLEARIHLAVGGCVAQVEAAITTRDIKCFAEELERLTSSLKGSASFTTDEGAINFQIKIDQATARIFGEVSDHRIAKVKVHFEYESDQSYLMKTLSEVKDL